MISWAYKCLFHGKSHLEMDDLEVALVQETPIFMEPPSLKYQTSLSFGRDFNRSNVRSTGDVPSPPTLDEATPVPIKYSTHDGSVWYGRLMLTKLGYIDGKCDTMNMAYIRILWGIVLKGAPLKFPFNGFLATKKKERRK